MTGKTHNPQDARQLGFPFFSPSVGQAATCQGNGSRTKVSLAAMLPQAQVLLLETPLDEVDQELLPLLELCEAVLTRALDVAQKRGVAGWSDAEYRSLRGIGQAQWLLVEAQAKGRPFPRVARRKKGNA